jgi:hypothetical protein
MATVYERFERLPNGKYRPVVGNKPAAVAMDAAPAVGSIEWFKDASEQEVNTYMNKRFDAAADKEIAAVLPLLKVFATAKDGKEEEAQALGLEGEEDSEEAELRHGQIISKDEAQMTIAERISTGYRAAKDFWKKSATRNRQRSQFAGSTGRYPSATATDEHTSKPSKHDLVAANAKAARQTSMFKRF